MSKLFVSRRTRAAAWVILLVLPALMAAFGYYHSHRPAVNPVGSRTFWDYVILNSDILLGLLAFAVTLRLRDAAAQQVQPPARQRMAACLRESMRFLSQSRQALRLISINAIVGAGATLLRFFFRLG